MPSVELESRPGFWLGMAAGFFVTFLLAAACERFGMMIAAGTLEMIALRLWAVARHERAQDILRFRSDLDRTET